MKNRSCILSILALLVLFAAVAAHAQEKKPPTTAPDLGPAIQGLKTEPTPDYAAPPPHGTYLTTCWGSRDSCAAQYPGDELFSPFGGDYEWWIYDPDYPIEP